MSSIAPLARAEDCALWAVDLDAPDALQWKALLSHDERRRAAAFVFEKGRLRYTAAHGALRHLLASHTGIAAEAQVFSTGEFGKPALRGRPDIAFSLSHSESTALVAIGSVALGVDLEVLRPIDNMQALAEAHFTAAEQRWLARSGAASQSRVFLTCWTRKEACLKAIGTGLSLDTRSFDVDMAHAAHGSAQVDAGASGLLSVSSFAIGMHAVAAIARVRSDDASRRGDRHAELCA